MPSVINCTTTNGIAVQGDNSGALALQTNNGTTALTIDTSQNVGIGTTSPTQKLDVVGTILASSRVRAAGFFNSTNVTGVLVDASTADFYTNNASAMQLDSSQNLKFNSGFGSVATAYGCRAWVNFNGTGTVAIRASGNVSSITDNGTGDYTVNLTTAMPDVNYSVSGVTNRNTTGGYGQYICTPFNQAQTSSAFRIATVAYDGNFYDCPQVTLMVVR